MEQIQTISAERNNKQMVFSEYTEYGNP